MKQIISNVLTTRTTIVFLMFNVKTENKVKDSLLNTFSENNYIKLWR